MFILQFLQTYHYAVRVAKLISENRIENLSDVSKHHFEQYQIQGSPE